jgi:predicted nucleotidyltransferase
MQNNSVAIKKSWNAAEQQVINEFVNKVRSTFKERAKKIILYGSRARGDADEESDYDFVVLLKPFYQRDKKLLSDLGSDVSLRFGTLVMAIAISLPEFSEDRYFYFYEDVCKEGIEF